MANASTLVGGVRVDKSSIAALQLINGSQWIYHDQDMKNSNILLRFTPN
ncbi:hypothetical protein [Bartonella vinsonii]|nr:hypothetical protein [Bartonella vinsonii]